MLYTGRIHPSTQGVFLYHGRCNSSVLAPAEAGLVPSKCLKLLLAAGQRCLLTEELCCITVTLQNKFSGDLLCRANFTVYELAISWKQKAALVFHRSGDGVVSSRPGVGTDHVNSNRLSRSNPSNLAVFFHF